LIIGVVLASFTTLVFWKYIYLYLSSAEPESYAYTAQYTLEYTYSNTTYHITLLQVTGTSGIHRLTLHKQNQVNITYEAHPVAFLEVLENNFTYSPFFTYHIIEYGNPTSIYINQSISDGWWYYWINLASFTPPIKITNLSLSQTSPPFLYFFEWLSVVPVFNTSTSLILNMPLEIASFSTSPFIIYSNDELTTPDNLTIVRGLSFTYMDTGLLSQMHVGYSLEYSGYSFQYSATWKLTP